MHIDFSMDKDKTDLEFYLEYLWIKSFQELFFPKAAILDKELLLCLQNEPDIYPIENGQRVHKNKQMGPI